MCIFIPAKFVLHNLQKKCYWVHLNYEQEHFCNQYKKSCTGALQYFKNM